MRQSLSQVKPYLAAKLEGLNLADNTNQMDPNPALTQLDALLQNLDLNEYPDNQALALRQALGRLHRLPATSFLIANGSNEAFDLIVKVFLNPGEKLAYVDPSFSMYPHYAAANAVEGRAIALDAAFDLDVARALAVDAGLTILCTPNNPTGNALSADRINEVLKSGRLVVVDEAYGEFAQDQWIGQIENYKNLIVTRTLSKAYGLAGLRIGYIAAQPATIDLITRARLPFNVNTLGQIVATAALRHQDYVRHYVGMVGVQRRLWAKGLQQRGFCVWPSQANFLFAEAPEGVARDALVKSLMERKILIRSCGTHPRMRDGVRITIGTAAQAEAFFDALDEALP